MSKDICKTFYNPLMGLKMYGSSVAIVKYKKIQIRAITYIYLNVTSKVFDIHCKVILFLSFICMLKYFIKKGNDSR